MLTIHSLVYVYYCICCFVLLLIYLVFTCYSPNWLQMNCSHFTPIKISILMGSKRQTHNQKTKNTEIKNNEYSVRAICVTVATKHTEKSMKLRKMNVCVKLREIEFSSNREQKKRVNKHWICYKFHSNNIHNFIRLTHHTLSTRPFFFPTMFKLKTLGKLHKFFPHFAPYFHVNIYINRFDFWIFHFLFLISIPIHLSFGIGNSHEWFFENLNL